MSNTLNHLKETLSSPVSGCRFKSAFWKCFSVQFSSVAQSCPTLCDPMDCTITNSRNLLKLMSIELVWSPCCSRDSQEPSPTPQFKSNNSLTLNFLYSSTHIHTWLLEKPYLWLDGSLLAKLCLCFLFLFIFLSLLFNMLSSFVITFLPRSKSLFHGCHEMQSPFLSNQLLIKIINITINWLLRYCKILQFTKNVQIHYFLFIWKLTRPLWFRAQINIPIFKWDCYVKWLCLNQTVIRNSGI